MKENNKQNFELISKLSELMEKQNITSLEYEIKEIKLKIEKKFDHTLQGKSKIINESIDKTKPVKTNEVNLEKSHNHPGAIKSPMVGTAYSASEPGKEPFIKLGDQIKIGQPLLIIEAMKVMNTINSEKNGKVTYIGFEDGQPIEFEQLLVIIE